MTTEQTRSDAAGTTGATPPFEPITVTNLVLTAERGSTVPTSPFEPISAGQDLAVVWPQNGIVALLSGDNGDVHAALRWRLRATVRPGQGLRISAVSGTVTGGLNVRGGIAMIRTTVSMGGTTVASTLDSSTEPYEVITSFGPADIEPRDADHCLELDVLLETLVARIDTSELAYAALDSLDLRFEVQPNC
jgi:hypothetical protein